jgi:hypothetical protein
MVRIALFCILSMVFFCGNSFAQVQENNLPDPKEFVLLEREPVPLNLDSVKQLIRHPQACIEGKVIVRLLMDENGKYMKHIILKTAHPMCTEAVEPVLHLIRFTPALIEGKAVKTWVTIPFKFGYE